MSNFLKGFLILSLILSHSLTVHGENDEPIILKRLKMPVSKSWTLTEAKENATSRDLIPTKFKGKALLKVFNPVTAKDAKSLQDHLAQAVANINTGRKTLKSFPKGVQSTLEGFPVAIQGEVTEDKKGSKRFTLSFGIAVGKSMQVVTLFALDFKIFQTLAKEVGTLIDKTKVIFPHATPKVRVMVDKAPKVSLFHAEYRCPSYFTPEKSRDRHVKKYSMMVPVAGVPKPVPYSVHVALYAAFPENSKSILSNWLLGTDFDLTAGKNDKSKMNVLTDFKVGNQRYSVGSLQTIRKRQIISNRYGIMVYGPKWTLCLGGAMGEGRAIRSLSLEQKNAVFQTFVKKVVPTLFAVAQSVTWSKEKILVRADIRAKLIEKKSYHYHYYSSSNITKSTIERYRYWTFRPDSCDSKGNTVLFVAPDYGREGLSGVVSSQNFERAGFRVLEWQKKSVLVVKRGRFFSSLHSVELNKSGEYGDDKFSGLAIDGRIEGKYSSFDTGKTRLPPPSVEKPK